MKVILNHDGQDYKSFSVFLSQEEGKPYFGLAAKILSETHPVKGFRPGQAPFDVIVKILPAGQVYQEVASQIVTKVVPKIVNGKEIKRLGDPLIEFKELQQDKDIEFSISLALWPTITLPDYSKITVGQEKSEATDKEVDEALEYLKKVRNTQTIDDAFAQSLGKFADVEALKTSIREGIVYDKTAMAQEQARAALLEKIRKQVNIELAPFLIEREAQKIIESEIAQLQESKIELPDYLKKIGKSEQEFIEQTKKLAKARLENALLINEIAKHENLKIAEQEIQERITRLLAGFTTPKRAKQHYDDPRTLQARVYQQLLEEKIFNQFLDKQIMQN